MSELLLQVDASGLWQAVVEYFRRLGSDPYNPWVILVELLLIGTVVHLTLSFLQGTRGARLMRGIAVVVVASFLVVRMLAQRFQWERIEFLYQYFVGAVFLVVLVVFQPELRRGLMRIGERLWFAGMFKQADKVVEPIVASVAGLSKKRIGGVARYRACIGTGGYCGQRCAAGCAPVVGAVKYDILAWISPS